MKRCVTCKEVKSFDSFHPDKSKADGHVSMCKACRSQYMKGYYILNKEKYKKEMALRYCKYRTRYNELSRKWVMEHPEERKRIQNSYYQRHKHLIQAKNRVHTRNYNLKNPMKNKEWKAKNPGKCLAQKARRRASEISANVKWANPFFIEEIYDLAKRRTKILGQKWVVDHIVPLNSPLVCGLHVENNLQVIPEIHNLRKHNRYWPDMPVGV